MKNLEKEILEEELDFNEFFSWITPALEEYGFMWKVVGGRYIVVKDGKKKVFDISNLISKALKKQREEILEMIKEKQGKVKNGTEFNSGVEAGYRYILNSLTKD